MIVDEPLKQYDDYRGDTGRERIKQISPRGFRFTSNQRERVQVGNKSRFFDLVIDLSI